MTIYIATDVNGRGILSIGNYDDKNDFHNVAVKWLERTDRGFINKSATIADICDALHDQGPCFGARSHYRISRKEALFLKREGVETYGF